MTTTTTEFQDNYSNESQTTDYTSIEGVRTRTGVNNDQLLGNFIIKELIDNALDFIEQNTKNAELTNRNDALQKKVNDLENRMTSLEAKK